MDIMATLSLETMPDGKSAIMVTGPIEDGTEVKILLAEVPAEVHPPTVLHCLDAILLM